MRQAGAAVQRPVRMVRQKAAPQSEAYETVLRAIAGGDGEWTASHLDNRHSFSLAARRSNGENMTQLSRHGVTVLIIEDDVRMLSACRQILEYAGYSVLVARRAQYGLSLFEDQRDSIDVALVDWKLPDLSGDHLIDRMIDYSSALFEEEGGHLRQGNGTQWRMTW